MHNNKVVQKSIHFENLLNWDKNIFKRQTKLPSKLWFLKRSVTSLAALGIPNAAIDRLYPSSLIQKIQSK